MEPSCVHFSEKLMGTSSFLQMVGHEVFEYWEPDPPPVIVLFAALGKELARQFDAVAHKDKENIFQLIEDGMTSDDVALRTAVATGIIEALIGATGVDEILWSRISLQLGDVSRHHAEAWRNS
jgi:hypothetical protein